MYIHISHKAVKSMAKLNDQLCGELWLAVCLLCHLKTTEHSWTSDKPQRQASAKYRLEKFHNQHQYLRELLVNLYSCCLMVKSVPCCCVRVRQLFSNPVIILYEWLLQFQGFMPSDALYIIIVCGPVGSK